MKAERVILGPRLQAIADAVRDGVTFYDVGTDHAYLPVYLLQQGKICSATASDVVSGPLSSAEGTVRRAGLREKVTLVLADGLRGIALTPPCDVTVAGMGGELIAAILAAAPQVRQAEVRLLLQPMTKAEELRAYLASGGFTTERELTVQEGKLYQILICSYTGSPECISEEELMMGKREVREENDLFYALAEQKLKTYEKAAEGKRRGGMTAIPEETKILSLRQLLTEKERRP